MLPNFLFQEFVITYILLDYFYTYTNYNLYLKNVLLITYKLYLLLYSQQINFLHSCLYVRFLLLVNLLINLYTHIYCK